MTVYEAARRDQGAVRKVYENAFIKNFHSNLADLFCDTGRNAYVASTQPSLAVNYELNFLNPTIPHEGYVVCDYCERRQLLSNEMCTSCGAPLKEDL